MIVSNIVVGLGEIGMPLFNIIRRFHPDTCGIDPAQGFDPSECDGLVTKFLHVCIPGEVPSFVRIVEDYIDRFKPTATIIHSTVPVGITTSIGYENVFHSPINGKHANMHNDLLKHPKFIGGEDGAMAERVIVLFESCGMEARYVGPSESTELGKILATTLFGYLIVWEQEVQRLCASFNLDREEVRRLWCEIDSSDWDVKSKYPGHIGGHCVMPNIELLLSQVDSGILESIKTSNKESL